MPAPTENLAGALDDITNLAASGDATATLGLVNAIGGGLNTAAEPEEEEEEPENLDGMSDAEREVGCLITLFIQWTS